MGHLILHGLTKVFSGGTKALADFSLDIPSGEFITIVGPSGCGKSTLLRLIAGLEEETSGSITLDGKNLAGLAPKDRDMAVMFQNYALFPHMTLAENMGFGLKIRKVPKEEIKLKVAEVATTLGIDQLLERYPWQMSGGQRQRAALGRAILRKPKIFLFDEPLSNLDAKMRAQMRIEIARLHQHLKATMIFVTHDQVEAMTLGNRVVVLKDGLMQQAERPEVIYANPSNAFVASFIGSPGMNLFTGRLIKNQSQLRFEHELFTLPVPNPTENGSETGLATWVGKSLVMGIRPEDIGPSKSQVISSEATLRGNLGVIERLGGNICLYFQKGKIEWSARVGADQEWQVGSEVELLIDGTKAIYFDPSTGLRI